MQCVHNHVPKIRAGVFLTLTLIKFVSCAKGESILLRDPNAPKNFTFRLNFGNFREESLNSDKIKTIVKRSKIPKRVAPNFQQLPGKNDKFGDCLKQLINLIFESDLDVRMPGKY